MAVTWWQLAGAAVVVAVAGLVTGFGVLLLIRVLDIRAARRERARRRAMQHPSQDRRDTSVIRTRALHSRRAGQWG